MGNDEWTPSEATAKRAAELWKRMLSNPKYDNVGENPSPQDALTGALARSLVAQVPNNAHDGMLEKFADLLEHKLLDTAVAEYERGCISVDYGPCPLLKDVADRVGLEMEFPWKTTMWVRRNYVSVSAGYGAEPVYHYPLVDGRWLVTTLQGSDIQKVIECVETGVLPEFEIEECSETAVILAPAAEGN